MELLQEKPATFGTKLAFDLMDAASKEQFNNDLTIFRNCLSSLEELNILSTAIVEAIENSQPKQDESSVPQEKKE